MSAWMWSLSRSVLSTSTRKTTWFIGLTPTQLPAISSTCAPSTHRHIPDPTPTSASILVCERWWQLTYDVPGVVPQPDCWIRLIVFVPEYAQACSVEREESSGFRIEG